MVTDSVHYQYSLKAKRNKKTSNAVFFLRTKNLALEVSFWILSMLCQKFNQKDSRYFHFSMRFF